MTSSISWNHYICVRYGQLYNILQFTDQMCIAVRMVHFKYTSERIVVVCYYASKFQKHPSLLDARCVRSGFSDQRKETFGRVFQTFARQKRGVVSGVLLSFNFILWIVSLKLQRCIWILVSRTSVSWPVNQHPQGPFHRGMPPFLAVWLF